MYEEIRSCELINDVEIKKVNNLIESFLTNGWNGMPILYCSSLNCLVTGSHRLTALQTLEENYYDYSDEEQEAIDNLFEKVEAIDVTDMINNYCELNDCTFDEIDFSSLRDVFQDTEIEKYAKEMEW